MGKLSRTKGASTERELVALHRRIGVEAERVPLSGAMRYQGNGEDLDVYPFGRDAAPLVCQVKRNLRGTKGVFDALSDADALFLRYDAEPGQQALPPTVVLPWRTWERILSKGRS
jgi:hypothetical protein